MYYFIINPHSRSGRGLSIWKKIEKELKRRNISYRHYFTRKHGDAEKFADKLTSRRKNITIVVVGGDGTVNEAINGIHDLSAVTLGYIPAGSSNDLARDVGIPKDAGEALKIILNPTHIASMDIGEITYLDGDTAKKRKFAVSCGIGFDAAVCHEALNSSMKNVLNQLRLGKLTYLGIALKQLVRAPKAECKIFFDACSPITLPRFLFVTSMIHRYEGGGFKFCPDANYSDGMINTCAVGNLSKLKIPFILPAGFTGKHLRYRGISSYQSRSMRLVSTTRLPVHCDGESCGYHWEVLVTCRKKQLHMIVR